MTEIEIYLNEFNSSQEANNPPQVPSGNGILSQNALAQRIESLWSHSTHPLTENKETGLRAQSRVPSYSQLSNSMTSTSRSTQKRARSMPAHNKSVCIPTPREELAQNDRHNVMRRSYNRGGGQNSYFMVAHKLKGEKGEPNITKYQVKSLHQQSLLGYTNHSNMNKSVMGEVRNIFTTPGKQTNGLGTRFLQRGNSVQLGMSLQKKDINLRKPVFNTGGGGGGGILPTGGLHQSSFTTPIKPKIDLQQLLSFTSPNKIITHHTSVLAPEIISRPITRADARMGASNPMRHRINKVSNNSNRKNKSLLLQHTKYSAKAAFSASTKLGQFLHDLSFTEGKQMSRIKVGTNDFIPHTLRSTINNLLNEINNIQKCGAGVEFLNNGCKYRGNMTLEGEMDGEGTCIYPNNKVYKGTLQNNQMNGDGMLLNPNGILVIGRFESDKLLSGKVQILYSDPPVYYDGGIKNSIKDGEGVMIYPNGDIFEGVWREDMRTGFGKLKLANDAGLFEGDFIRDAIHGEGSFVDWNGDTYTANTDTGDIRTLGSYKRAKLNGEGKASLKSGDEYSGCFKDGKFSGNGELVRMRINMQNGQGMGSSYKGQWKNGMMNGKGKLEYDDLTTFVGQHRNNMRYYGRAKFINTWEYEGYWHNNNMEGKGTLYFEDGRSFQTQFKNGRALKYGRIVYKNEDLYLGEINENFEREGVGQLLTHTQDIYMGQWKMDAKEGKGRIYYANGDHYVGAFSRDEKSGKGKQYDSALGEYYEGGFSGDKRQGRGRLITAIGHVVKGIWADGTMTSKVDWKEENE